MSKPLLIIGLIFLFLAVEGGRMWYCQQANEQAVQALQAQSQTHIDSLASAEIDELASDLSGEWAARMEQEQQLQQALKDSIFELKEALARAKYGNLKSLIDQLGEAGVRKQEKNQTLSLNKMATSPWGEMRIFMEESVPDQLISVKLTRPLKNTESVTWKTGEVYYLQENGGENLLEVYLLKNTKEQALVQWRYYSGFKQ